MNQVPLRDHPGIDDPSPNSRGHESREGSNNTNPARRTEPRTKSSALSKRRIAIVRNEPVGVREGVELTLAANRRVESIYLACCLEELAKAGIHVDAVILDQYLEHGRRTASTISAFAARYPVLIVSASARRDDMLAAIQAGASGYVTTNASGDAIIEAVETIATDGFYLSLHVSGDDRPAGPTGAQVALSRREREALLYISQGLTQAQTANRMGVSPATIDTYVKRIRCKIGPGNKAALIRQAIRLGYLDPESIHQLDGGRRGTTGRPRDHGRTRCPPA